MLEDINEIDRKGPRVRKKYNRITFKPFFIKFREKYPEYKNKTDKELKQIIRGVHEEFMNTICSEREGISLLSKLGHVFIGACDLPDKTINYSLSLKYGKKVNEKNWDTDNLLCKIFYTNSNKRYSFKSKILWTFKASRQLKQKASKAFKKNYFFYIKVPSNIIVSSLFRNQNTN